MKMERKFLEGLGIEKETIDKILDQHSTEIGKQKQALTALETERDGLKEQLTDAQKSIQSYKDMDIDSIQKAAADWEAKYNTDTKALQDKLSAQAYHHAVEKIASAERFSSAAARKAFVADLTAKELKLEGEKLIGYDDFRKTYQETDPDAFAPADDGGNPPPHVVARTSGGESGGALSALRAAFGLSDAGKES